MTGLGIGELIFLMPVAVVMVFGLDFFSPFENAVGDSMITTVSMEWRLDGEASCRDGNDCVCVSDGTGVSGRSDEYVESLDGS